jgi:Ca-activated chloride channel family protein
MAAAILFFVIGASYLASVVVLTSLGRPTDHGFLSPLAVDWGPLNLEAAPPEEEALLDLAGGATVDVRVAEAEEEPGWELFQSAPSQGPASEVARVFASGDQSLTDVVLARLQPLAAQPVDVRLPDLVWAPKAPAGGHEPALVPGFDRLFLARTGVFPVIDPRAHPTLATSTTTLSTSRASFHWAALQIAEGHEPRPRDIRVEDFLAVLDYGFLPPQEPESVALRTAAGPSTFGAVGRGLYPQLLQVAAVAGSANVQAAPATHLIVAIDVSTGMDWNGGLERVRRGLVRLFDHLGPADRISLVAFNEEVVWLVEGASSEDRQTLLDTVGRLQSHGARNIQVGLESAVRVALSADLQEGAVRRVALVTEGQLALSGENAEAIEAFVRTAAQQGLRLDVIDTGQHEESPAYLEQLAAAGGGQTRRGGSADQIRWALVESLLGRSPVVASQASLSLKFNPEAVAQYRLLGHEPPIMGIAAPDSRAGELRCLETATVLYEVWLHPNDVNDIATAEVSWIDARTGAARQRQQPISRLQFASSFGEAAPSLQAATVAAQTAELLRHSPFATGGPRAFDKVFHVASSVDPRLAEQPSFQRFMAFLRQLRER